MPINPTSNPPFDNTKPWWIEDDEDVEQMPDSHDEVPNNHEKKTKTPKYEYNYEYGYEYEYENASDDSSRFIDPVTTVEKTTRMSNNRTTSPTPREVTVPVPKRKGPKGRDRKDHSREASSPSQSSPDAPLTTTRSSWDDVKTKSSRRRSKSKSRESNPFDTSTTPSTGRSSKPTPTVLATTTTTAPTSSSKRQNKMTTTTTETSPSKTSIQEKLSRTTKILSNKASETWSSIRDAKATTTKTKEKTRSGSHKKDPLAPTSKSSTSSNSREDSRDPHRDHSESSRHSSSSRNQQNDHDSHHRSTSGMPYRRYTVQELIQSIGDHHQGVVDLPPALERRVRDFKFAQQKRKEKTGGSTQRAWGVFGLYAHLSDIRADLEWAEDAAWRRQRSEPYLSWTDFEKGRDKGLNNRPWFTYSMLAICTIMMMVTIGVNGWKLEPLNVNPLLGPSSDTLVMVGARQSDLMVNQGQYFRLFTPLILHAGLIHFIINMMALYFLGGAVEQSHGWLSALVLFVVPAVGGNILSAICLPQYISVGASGGIFGLIGGCLADIAINWNLLFLKSTTEEGDRWRHAMVLFWLAFDIIINCVIGLTPFVDNFTHLGGLIYGLLCGLSTIEKLAVGFFGLQSKDEPWWKMYLVRFFGLITSILAILITTVLLVKSDGVTSPCHGCRYISCVPFPPNADEKWWACDDCDFVTADLFIRPSDKLYEEIELTCPDRQIESIDITDKLWYDKEQVRKALPSYCRDHCENVFATQQKG